MEAIVVSGLPASGKTVAVGLLSRELGVPMVGGTDILKQMAIERGYRPGGEDWWDGGEGMRFLRERKTNQDFDKETDRRLSEIIKKGDVVVTSYTAPWIIKEGFKVWLLASQKTRAGRMAMRDGIAPQEAIKVIEKRDEENRKLYMALYKIDFGHDTSPFHLVIDTENVDSKGVVRMVIDAYKKRNKS